MAAPPEGRQAIQSKLVNDTFKTQSFGGSGSGSNQFDLHSDVKPAAKPKDNMKELDILTLKKMVIEEIKGEL